MDNPEKLATQVTQDKEKQSKNTTQYVLDTTIHNQMHYDNPDKNNNVSFECLHIYY